MFKNYCFNSFNKCSKFAIIVFYWNNTCDLIFGWSIFKKVLNNFLINSVHESEWLF